MVNLYTVSSCSSCKKAKSWFTKHDITFHEKNFNKIPLTKKEIKLILQSSENGFEDIISTRSRVFKEKNIEIDELTINEACDLLISNPSLLKKPIMLDEKLFLVGYNEDDIRAFIPPEKRDYSFKYEPEEEIDDLISIDEYRYRQAKLNSC